jgi:hypothetical protein
VHLDDLVTALPTEGETRPRILKLYYIINQAPDDRLNRDESFNAWLKKYAKSRGQFWMRLRRRQQFPPLRRGPISTSTITSSHRAAG